MGELFIGIENLLTAIYALQNKDDQIETKISLLFITHFICEAIQFASHMKPITKNYDTT